MSVCVFCAIAQGQAPASLLYQDAVVVAFLDIAPITPGHLLVVPKRHVASLADLDAATGAQLFQIALRLAHAVRAAPVRAEGLNLWLADGAAAGQDVGHLHLHVIPRFAGDGFHIAVDWPPPPDRATLDQLAQAIRHGLPAGPPAAE